MTEASWAGRPGPRHRAWRQGSLWAGLLLLVVLAGCASPARQTYMRPAPPPAPAPKAADAEAEAADPDRDQPRVVRRDRMAWPDKEELQRALEQARAQQGPDEARASAQEPAEDTEERRDGPLFSDFGVLEPYLEGVASWYGPGFHGKPTANGETYNQYALTAAHPVLPMDTRIEVENLANGRKVWVRVNDRGPYAKGRILDLSRLAAERIGMVQEGTAPVRIRIRRWPATVDTELGLTAYGQYVVQVAAFPERQPAEAHRDLQQSRFPQVSFLVDQPPNAAYSVVAGPYDEEATAWEIARHLQQHGITNLVRRYRK